MFNSLDPQDYSKSKVDCDKDPIESLKQMFVDMVQKGRIEQGQCPALRPVFLKPHGVAHGQFLIREDLPDELRVGLFAGAKYPLWVRFSSDTSPTRGDFKSTLGIGLKLFDTPTPKIFGRSEDTTFDFILQNMDVFFVDTAKDMCEFTKAAVVDGDIDTYLKAHPKTASILNEMAKPVGSVFGSPYWSGLPFAFGPDRFVKYMLQPTIEISPPTSAPADPTYLNADLIKRLSASDATFRFCIQFRTNPKTMPLDQATVPWPETESPYVHVADIILPQQDINSRGQSDYGENLSMNIWRVTADHTPQGSLSDARKVVYEASAELRKNVNGIPDGEPASPKPPITPGPCVDDVIVRAAIHPGIGIARVGDSKDEFYIGPEVTDPDSKEANFYRDSTGAIKREAARFRIYGYNASGEVVRELSAQNADISWTAHLANRKASWYRFITAMDIPETKDLSLPLRNAFIEGDNRKELVIDPGPRNIAGASVKGGAEHSFDTGKFKKKKVYLGEIQTDESGCLLVLGGHGKSHSPSGAPPFDPKIPDTFNNADDWYDDVADGPVTASVSIAGRPVPVDGSWIVIAPPNYAPDIISWRTLYDLLVDVYIDCGWLAVPTTTSFANDVLPQLKRFSNLQWVNKGFAAMFGKGGPMDFENPAFLERLSTGPDTNTGEDPFHELRQQILNAFRPFENTANEPRIWPWIYGDSFSDGLFAKSPRTMLALPAIQQTHLERWMKGDFLADWDPSATEPTKLVDVPLADQPAMLDKAALHFCLADAFHPGCEMTWPMRHATLYQRPFRIRHRKPDEQEPSYGRTIDQKTILSPSGPLHSQGPGDISKWMGLPWQGDTAYCRSGYDNDYDSYLPTFWPARVPNQILKEEDYLIVVDETQPREARLAAFNRRDSWFRQIDIKGLSVAERMERMVDHFGSQGVVEAMPGIKDDPDFPAVIYVEKLPQSRKDALVSAAKLAVTPVPVGSLDERIQRAGWGDAEHLEQARKLRARRK